MTTIEWTHPPGFRGESWNPVTGCTKVSQGCRNCYAEREFPRAYAKTGRKFTDIALHEDRLDKPLRRRAPTCWFVNSMSDLFHDEIDPKFIAAVWTRMAMTPRHRYIVLTKRPERLRNFLTGGNAMAETLRNVWIGVSVEDQPTADERIPLLLQTPAAVRFVSYEPALGPVDFDCYPSTGCPTGWLDDENGLDWIIVGGESGPRARHFEIGWARLTVEQCKSAGIPVFVKQFGTKWSRRLGITWKGKNSYTWNAADRKGADPNTWPEDLRVREWPCG